MFYKYPIMVFNDATVSNITAYYKQFEKAIIRHAVTRPLSFYWDYPFDWTEIMTPIELDAWGIIRSIGLVVLYPQYPVLNYRADFANPYHKIILECDGKDYHSPQRDRVRDNNLLKEGWKVYRVTGKELYRIAEIRHDFYTEEVDIRSLEDHYLNSAEGVIKAIRTVYFTKRPYDGYDEVPILEMATLKKHRLVEFKIDYPELKNYDESYE